MLIKRQPTWNLDEAALDKAVDLAFADAPMFGPPLIERPKKGLQLVDEDLHRRATIAMWEAPVIASVANAVEPGTGSMVLSAAQNLVKQDRRVNAASILPLDSPYLEVFIK